jgi:putative pyruvate formate lyase activating enzyme
VLPGHSADSVRVLQALNRRFGRDILYSVMFQYIPMGEAARYPEINRRLTTLECRRVQKLLEEMDVEGYVQQRSAASEEYVPDFSMQGVIGAGEEVFREQS